MRLALAALLVVLGCGSGDAQQVMAFGIGQEPCAVWLASKRHFEEGRAWIAGYWTAANVLNLNTHVVGSKTDANGLADAVKAACREKPSRLLMDAVAEAYARYPN